MKLLRTPLLATALVALPLLAACSDDSSSEPTVTAPAGQDPVSTAAPDTEGAGTPDPDGEGTDAPGAFTHPTGADEAIVRISMEGGFVPADVAFGQVPSLVVGGDGAVYTPGPMTMEYPGRLVLPVQRATLSEDGVQSLLALAADLGLLAEPPEYPRDDQVADAPDTVVELTVDGTTYRHQAYALVPGADTETDPGRQALAEFVAAAQDLASTVPDGALGETEFAAVDLEIRATPVDDVDTTVIDEGGVSGDAATVPAPGDGVPLPESPVVEWASSTGVTLADAGECAVVPLSDTDAMALLDDARATTQFSEGDITYDVAVRAQLPGGPAC